MTPPAAPTAPPSDPEPVDRLGPRPIARARSGPERSPTSALSLRLRFADDREAEPGIELPEGQPTLVEGTRGTEAARHRLVLDAAT